MYGGCRIGKNSQTALSVRTNMETVGDPGAHRSSEGCVGAVPKQDGTTECQNDRWRHPGRASILPVCAAAHRDVHQQLGPTRTDVRWRKHIYIWIWANHSSFDTYGQRLWSNRWHFCPHAHGKSVNTQILIACLYKRSIVWGLQQVYIFYINHLIKITDLEKSFYTVHYIWRITATRLLFIWISLYMSTVHIK